MEEGRLPEHLNLFDSNTFSSPSIHTNTNPQIPMLGRGMRPAWNTDLVRTHASIVELAIISPLCRAAVLQRHLNTTIRTILRSATLRNRRGESTVLPPANRLYRLSEADIALETDAFLQRSGPPSFEFPFTRDNYYMLLSYLPNRRWLSLEEGKWLYHGALHETDVAWAARVHEGTMPRTEGGGDAIAVPECETRKT
jgi:hypothetical protein